MYCSTVFYEFVIWAILHIKWTILIFTWHKPLFQTMLSQGIQSGFIFMEWY
jgi:hypothetical protein